jgi:hypothetical protein
MELTDQYLAEIENKYSLLVHNQGLRSLSKDWKQTGGLHDTNVDKYPWKCFYLKSDPRVRCKLYVNGFVEVFLRIDAKSEAAKRQNAYRKALREAESDDRLMRMMSVDKIID